MENSINISVSDFVKTLLENFNITTLLNTNSTKAMLQMGHKRGWLEDQDERFPDTLIDKRTAARILHQFMKIELKIPDTNDIKSAEILQDLYTCRVCVNHIAQMYVKGIMEKEEVFVNGIQATVFNNSRLLSKTEASKIISSCYQLCYDTDL